MYTIQERVRIVILMAKYESVRAVKKQLTKEGFQHKPTDQTKFSEEIHKLLNS